MKQCVKGWLALFVSVVPGSAWADAKDATMETGVRLGEKGRLHLSLAANLGIDSNPNFIPWELMTARQNGETASFFNGPAVSVPRGLLHPNKVIFSFPPDAYVAVRPSVNLSLPGDRFSANGAASINYFEYLGILNPGLPFIPGTEASKRSLELRNWNTGYRRLRTIDGTLGGGIELNRAGAFGVGLNGGISRAIDPGPIVVGTRLARTALSSSLAAGIRPGGGAMSFTGSAGLNLELYDPQNGRWFGQEIPTFYEWDQFPLNLLGEGNPVDVLGLAPAANATVDPNKFHNGGASLSLNWTWRFLPKSAVFVEGGTGFNAYLWPYENSNAPSASFHIQGGFMGQITAKLGLVASAGINYPVFICFDPFEPIGPTQKCATNSGLVGGSSTTGTGTSDLDTIFSSFGVSVSEYTWWAPEITRWQSYVSAPNGQLELRYQFTPTFSGSLGVRRQLRLVPLYRYLSDNRIYASLSGTLWDRLQIGLSVAESLQPHGQLTDTTVGYNSYPFDPELRAAVPFLADSDPGRWDNDLTLSAGVDVFATSWLLFGIGNSLNWHVTNARTGEFGAVPGIYNEAPFNLSYLRNLTMLRAELRY
jgi:hypothetical protein